MSHRQRMLAVIPARGGSKGLPGKNIRNLAGLPLIAHSILFAKLCPEIDRIVVSTDSEEIARVARHHGADVPFLRPASLASDETPLWPVLQHALTAVEESETPYDLLLLLDPTSPARTPADVSGALERLDARPDAHGVIGVSQPTFNPIWHSVVERDGWMTDLVDSASSFHRRQDVPATYRINGSIYLWRTSFVQSAGNWRKEGRHLLFEIPEPRAMSIDTSEDFERAELLVTHGRISLPWLHRT